ncbi:hypothetical protein, partial [Mesorhizobium sp. B2-5-9]
VRLGTKSYLVRTPVLECEGCGGTGQVFQCPRWTSSSGLCCPAGTHRRGCPGASARCAQCSDTDSTGPTSSSA